MTDTVAPSPEALPREVFPLNKDLGELLLKPELPPDLLLDPPNMHPNWIVARTLATCAGYAYSGAATVRSIMARMGLEDCRCRPIELSVDAMFIVSTAYVIESKGGKVVILVYRGTEPGNFINWLTDVDLQPDTVKFNLKEGRESLDCEVHAGFYRNFRATRHEVEETLFHALDREPLGGVYPMEALYITGHSLGGAMAALMGITIQTEPGCERLRKVLRAVYTFGQPMIGSREFADACTEAKLLDDKLIRFIYQKDPVPHLPPRGTGKWKNYGREYQYVDGEWPRNTKPVHRMFLLQLVGSVAAFFIRLIPFLRRIPLMYQFNDHGPQHYIAALTPSGQKSEYGDFNPSRKFATGWIHKISQKIDDRLRGRA